MQITKDTQWKVFLAHPEQITICTFLLIFSEDFVHNTV